MKAEWLRNPDTDRKGFLSKQKGKMNVQDYKTESDRVFLGGGDLQIRRQCCTQKDV